MTSKEIPALSKSEQSGYADVPLANVNTEDEFDKLFKKSSYPQGPGYANPLPYPVDPNHLDLAWRDEHDGTGQKTSLEGYSSLDDLKNGAIIPENLGPWDTVNT